MSVLNLDKVKEIWSKAEFEEEESGSYIFRFKKPSFLIVRIQERGETISVQLTHREGSSMRYTRIKQVAYASSGSGEERWVEFELPDIHPGVARGIIVNDHGGVVFENV